MDLNEKISNLPTEPGVYLYRDTDGNVLYVGKAKRLRNRVRSYFQNSADHDGRIRTMVKKIADVEVIVTDSEGEALILENNLIKKHHPRYNVMYRDDKSYPYICINQGERPRVFPTRTVLDDGSTYYGPYDHVGQMRRMLDTIREAFGLCTCACSSKIVDKTRGLPKWRSCLKDYLGNCSADQDLEEYQATIHKVKRLLNGRTEKLIQELKEEMHMASQSLEFEKAAHLRDSLQSIQKYSQKMKMVANKAVDRDIFAIRRDEEINMACGVQFKIREGKLIGKFHRFLKNIEGLSESEILQTFVEDYYTGKFAGAIPDEVYVSHELVDDAPLFEYLWEQHGKKVPIHKPQIGEKAQMMRMALSNAKLMLGEKKVEKQKAEREHIPEAIKELKKHLGLQRLPRRIECFDNSNLQGTDPVASMVQFVDGQPRKSSYKRFHIKTVEGPDDYASMREVVKRRYSRVMREQQHIPDLIVVDGGKGQLSSAVEALKEIGFYGESEIVGLAKRLEEVYRPNESVPVMIPKTSGALKILQQARDEAHRFAITFHRNKRNKRTLQSELEQIKGVGSKTAEKLLNEFGSVKQVQQSDRSRLQQVAGESLGKVIYDYFHPGSEDHTGEEDVLAEK